jgi:outer membrane protease
VEYKAPHWSLAFTGKINLSKESAQRMQDSDWEDDTMPFQKTIFSESQCRLDKGVLIDSKLLFHPPYFRTNLLKGVIGYRYQKFQFTTHDGEQMSIHGHIAPLPGDGIEFMQKFLHVYFGGELNFNVNRLLQRTLPAPIKTTIKGDYAIVDALNEDLHLLRLGERITREDTIGHCWRVGLSASTNIGTILSLELDADFKRIITHGDHKLMNAPLGVYFAFNGSEVWSDQLQISLNAIANF